MKKRLLALALSLLLALSLIPAALAATGEANQAARELYEMGLFQGTGTNADGTPNFALDRTMTRAEAVTMLVRLLGKEAEAKAGTWTTPFTDVAAWAVPYVGYAYENGLTKGVSATAFGGGDTVTATQYLTFVLRALGYDSGSDFRWDAAWELSDKLGFTSGQYAAGGDFLRGDAAIVSNNALAVKRKDSGTTLRETLAKPAAETGAPEIKAWYSVDADGRLWVETDMKAKAGTTYGIVMRVIYADGGTSNNGDEVKGSSGNLRFPWFVGEIDLKEINISYVDCLVFDRPGGRADFFQRMEQNRWRFDETLKTLPEPPAAQFRLENDVTVKNEGESIRLTSLELNRDEAKGRETYIPAAESLDRHLYALVYAQGTQVKKAAVANVRNGALQFDRELDYFENVMSSGTFYLTTCRYSVDGEGGVLCARTVSNGLDWSFEKE